MTGLIVQATLFLIAAVVAVPIAVRFGLGSVLGYLIAGIMIGPVFGLIGSDVEQLQHFAEFGVVLMLFLIGLELEPRALWDMRQRLLGLGGMQILVTTAAITGAGIALGFGWNLSLAIGLVMSLSSTAIVLQTLTEKKLMHTRGGRSAFSVLLSQDIAVIPMLALLPLLAVARGEDAASQSSKVSASPDGSIKIETPDDAHSGVPGFIDTTINFVQELPAWGITLVTIAAIASIILGGHYLTRPIYRFVHSARLREMDTAMALLFVGGVASLMLVVGLSPALGTFLAGVVLANSEFRHELEADIAPFKGLLLGLFFMTVGAGINFELLMANPGTILGLTLGLILIKGLILYALALTSRLRGRDRWLFTLSLAQAGEFGFVLISFGYQTNVIPGSIQGTLYLVVALSMLVTPLLFILAERISEKAHSGSHKEPEDEIDEQQPVIIAGVGRFGQVVNRMVQMTGMKATVLDSDLEMIQLMRRFGFKGFFGDPTRPELLHAAGLSKAKVLVVALDDRKASIRLVQYARKERPDIHIVARAHDRVHVYELFRAGTDDIVREMFDSSLRAARYVLENMGMDEFDASEAERAFYKLDRKSMLELAELWEPGTPIAENEAYMTRARELNRDLEAAVVATLDETPDVEFSDKVATMESETAERNS